MNRPHAHLVRCPPSNGGAPVVGPASAGRGNAHGRPPPEGGPTGNGGAPVVGPASAGRGNARGHPPPEGGPTSGGPAEPFGRPGGH